MPLFLGMALAVACPVVAVAFNDTTVTAEPGGMTAGGDIKNNTINQTINKIDLTNLPEFVKAFTDAQNAGKELLDEARRKRDEIATNLKIAQGAVVLIDQVAHYGCKIVWAAVAIWVLPHEPGSQLARVRAVGAHRAIAGVLGADLTIYLLAFVVDDLSFNAMNRRFGGGAASPDRRKEFSITMRVLLCVLPGIYAAIDRKRAASPASAAMPTAEISRGAAQLTVPVAEVSHGGARAGAAGWSLPTWEGWRWV